MIRSLFWFLGLIVLSCTQPPVGLNSEITVSVLEQIEFNELPQKIRGSGDISISADGKGYYGYADINWERSGTFRADFYSPFGTTIASVRADSVNGIASIQEERHEFKINEKIDFLPQGLGSSLTFGELMGLLTGQVSFFCEKLKAEPDSTVSQNRSTALFWKDGDVTIRVDVSKKTRIQSVLMQSQGWNVKFESIKEKLARNIEFREDDKNYFSIKYEQLKSE